jgi:DNA helicase-2/ATP-dependent DNA helicase PcrA
VNEDRVMTDTDTDAATETTTPPARDADTIADALGRPRPTAQQRAVIESPLAPSLVVAGAGSGKTETMASRVVWLLANGLVRPDQVLGLTFTRKAAGELSIRINDRIRALEDAGLIAPGDAFEAPTVSTYNAFANSVFRENALLVGRDGESQVLTEPSAWQLARRVVVSARDDRLAGLDRNVDTITAAVVSLAGAASEHLVEPEQLRRFAIEFSELLELPGNRGKPYAAVTAAVSAIGALEPLTDLVAEFRRQKVDRGFVEFSDQIALALAAAEAAPRVVSDLRQRFRVVLLDEYQDTSVVQTRFLARLFREHAVMAVGDPHQSIYGFRGASAANLARFPRDFGGDGEQTAHTFALSTSWRNPVDVLAAANAVVSPLSEASEVDVERLSPRPGADDGTVDVVFTETLPEEALAVAAWFEDHRRRNPSGSMALLLRARKDLAAFTAAFTHRGVPFHVLGTGGLLQRPEIVDLVACLRVLHDPAAGNDLIRLLAGARWRVGAADVAALHALASWLFKRDHTQQRLDDDVTAAFRASVAAGEHGSVVDALDFVAVAPDDHGALQGITDAGRDRMRRLGQQLAALRSRAAGDLVDFVTLVIQEMHLDIEVAAHEQGSSAYLDAFVDELAGFVGTDDRADLGAFLGWVDAAARRDDMGPRSEEPEGGTVQILTIHGSKGLEWDAVAVPRMVEGALPARPQEGSSGWIGFGRLPYEFRGDADELPRLAWRGHDSQKDVTLAIEAFKDEVKARNEDEERRLTYVALTRSRHELLVSGSFWAGGVKPTMPSRYLAASTRSARYDPGDHHARGQPPRGRRRDADLAARAVRRPGPACAGRRRPGAEREPGRLRSVRRRHRPAARRTPCRPVRQAPRRRAAPCAGVGLQGLPHRPGRGGRAAPASDARASLPRHPSRHAVPPVGRDPQAVRRGARDPRRLGRRTRPRPGRGHDDPDRRGRQRRRRPPARRVPGHVRPVALGGADTGRGRARDPHPVPRAQRRLQARRRLRDRRPHRGRGLEDGEGTVRGS